MVMVTKAEGQVSSLTTGSPGWLHHGDSLSQQGEQAEERAALPTALCQAVLTPFLKATAAGGELGGCSGPGRQLGPFLACLMLARPSRNGMAWIPALGEGAQAPEACGASKTGILALLSTWPLPKPRLHQARGLLPGSFFKYIYIYFIDSAITVVPFFLPFIPLCPTPPPMVLRIWKTQGLDTVGGMPLYPEPLPQAAAASAFS